jgi:hypothetical protein
VDDPYRASGAPSPGPIVELTEAEPPLRAVRVRAWSDGTTRLRITPKRSSFLRFVAWSIIGLLVLSSLTTYGRCETKPASLFFLVAAFLLAERGMRGPRHVRITVTPAALQIRSGLWRAKVFALADVATVVVRGSGDGTHLELQVGREHVPFAANLGYDGAHLRWVALRLRKAIEAAR